MPYSGAALGVLEVAYLPQNGKVEVWSYSAAQDWVQRGSAISVSYAAGDVFGAAMTASGQVRVYKNGSQVGTADASGWTYAAGDGYIGLWLHNAGGTAVDDFGGGTIPVVRRLGEVLAALWGWVRETFGAGKVLAAPERARHAIQAPPAGQVWKNYVFIGGRRMAVRVYESGSAVGTVSFLLTDHLGSLSVVADANGNLVSELRYTAFGELRAGFAVSGVSGYTYTGQLSQMQGLGLMFYQARFYDPVTSHFVSADTMVPDPYNPLAWDRYLYTLGNPIRYNDPSGHDVDCGLQERCKLATANEFTRVLTQTYKLNISKSAAFTTREMRTIYNAVGTIEAGANGLTNGSGLNWTRNHFSDTTIARTPSTLGEKMVFNGNSHVGGSTIYLAEKFADTGWVSLDGKAGTMLIHEFGHVLDNRSKSSAGDATIFGGGAGDQLMNFINAKPRLGVRASGGISFGENPFPEYEIPYPDIENVRYGNNSTADYFANTFAAAVVGYDSAPVPAVMWMVAFIDLTK